MDSNQIKSSSATASILANLEQKIAKYLSPSYQTSSILDKSKAMTKNYEEIIQHNKDFLKKNQSQHFIKTQYQNPGNQFDQLLHRRKKCEAKLHQMLLDHQVEESLKFEFSPIDIHAQKASYRPTCNEMFSVSSLKQTKSQVLFPNSNCSQPNYLRIQKQLQSMQKKLQKLCKKVDNKSSSKKIVLKKESSKQSKISSSSKIKKSVTKMNEKTSQAGSDSKNRGKKQSGSLKKGNSVEFIKRLSSRNNLKQQNQNSQQKTKKPRLQKNPCDQTSLFAKLTGQKGKINQSKEMNNSKLKKVGLSKFNQNSKKTIEMAKNNAEQKSQHQIGLPSQKHKPNHIKVNLLQCQSEHVL